jgi:replicative DNA helicase
MKPSELKIHEQINIAKKDPKALDSILYPGRQLSEYNTKDLTIDVLPSGFPSFDKMLLFKRNRGELIFIGARPSMGKSALLFNLATNIARQGKTHVISLEDGHEAIATRQTASILNVSMDLIQHGLVSSQRLEEAKAQLAQINCIVDDEGGLNVHQICERIRMQHKKGPISAAFIDYIQIIKSERKVSRAEDIAAISSELKALAKDLRITVVVASQLNRNADTRENKKPQLSDLKESGSLEQDADVVLLIHRNGQEAEVTVAKNKNGPTGDVKMRYIGAQCLFQDLGKGVAGKYGELE